MVIGWPAAVVAVLRVAADARRTWPTTLLFDVDTATPVAVVDARAVLLLLLLLVVTARANENGVAIPGMETLRTIKPIKTMKASQYNGNN